MNTPLPQFILSPDKGLSLHRSGSQIVTMMQATQSWRRGNSCSRFGSAYSHTTVRCSLIQRQMRPVFVVQVGYKTPIKLVIAKCITVGTPGAGSRCTFKLKRDAEAVWYCAACKAK